MQQGHQQQQEDIAPPGKLPYFSRLFSAVLRIRIYRIHMFLGLLDPDPDPSVRGMDPDSDLDPSITKQKK
jgi:hypothetical protein